MIRSTLSLAIADVQVDHHFRDIGLEDHEDWEQLYPRWRRLSVTRRRRRVIPLIIRATESQDKRLLLSLPPPIIADVIEETHKVRHKGIINSH